MTLCPMKWYRIFNANGVCSDSYYFHWCYWSAYSYSFMPELVQVDSCPNKTLFSMVMKIIEYLRSLSYWGIKRIPATWHTGHWQCAKQQEIVYIVTTVTLNFVSVAWAPSQWWDKLEIIWDIFIRLFETYI